MDHVDTTKNDTQDAARTKEANKVTDDSSMNDDKKVESERKGLRALFQRKAATKTAPTDNNPVQAVNKKEAPTMSEPKTKIIEQTESMEPAAADEDDDEKPVQRRRQKWSLKDVFNRYKKEPKKEFEKTDAKVIAPVEATNNAKPNSLDLPPKRANNQGHQERNIPAAETSIEADDVSESSTMASDNEGPVRQQVSRDNPTVVKSKQPKAPETSPTKTKQGKKPAVLNDKSTANSSTTPAKKVQVDTKVNPVSKSTKPVSKLENRLDDAPQRAQTTKEHKTKTVNAPAKPKKVDNLKKMEAPKTAPNDAKSIDPKNQKKSGKKTNPLKMNQNAAKNEKTLPVVPEQKKVESKKPTRKSKNKPRKCDQPNPQPEQTYETVPRDRALQSTHQKTPWDGVSSAPMKEQWDDKYKKKKANGNGNEPLMICAAPPEDEDDYKIASGNCNEPLMICAASPEDKDADDCHLRMGGAQLLAICAANTVEGNGLESDDEGNDDIEEADDVSESETMATDDEVEEIDGEDDAEETNIDDFSESDKVSTHDNVSESETVLSDDGDEADVNEATSVSMPSSDANNESDHPSTTSINGIYIPMSNERVATSREHEKSEAMKGTIDTAKNKEETSLKKKMKVLTEEERRKCYMWYDRMGRPTRDKMKQRIPLMKDCDISLEDVDALPWMCRGTMISQSELNKLILR